MGQSATTGNVIGLNVRVNDILDLHSFSFRKLDICTDIIGLWVHDRGPSFTGSTEDVSGTAGVVIEILFEDHTKTRDSFLTHFFAVTIIACEGNLI